MLISELYQLKKSLSKCNKASGLAFIFITTKHVPITHYYHNQFYHQLLEI